MLDEGGEGATIAVTLSDSQHTDIEVEPKMLPFFKCNL